MEHNIGGARFELFPNFEHSSHRIASESAHLMTSHQDYRQHHSTAESHLPTMHIEGAHRASDARHHHPSRVHTGEHQALTPSHAHSRHSGGEAIVSAHHEKHQSTWHGHAKTQDTDDSTVKHTRGTSNTDTSTVAGGEVKSAVASWYHEGTRTANGEHFNPDGLTAASKTLPFGTRLEVTNPANGNHVIVRINDRGPYIQGRSIDLSRGAARQLGMIDQGVAHINYRIL